MNTGNTARLGPKSSSLQIPSSVGFQAASEDNVTTQTKPLGCHQPDIGIVIPTAGVTGKAVLGRTKTNLNVLVSMTAGKWSPGHAGLRTRLGGGGAKAQQCPVGLPRLVGRLASRGWTMV